MRGIRARLLLFVALALTPLLLFTIHQGVEQRRRAAARERAEARRLVMLLRAEHGRVMADARQLLFVLAHGPTIRRAEPVLSAGLFRDIVGASPQYPNLMLATADGQVLAAARPEELVAADLELMARAVTHELAASPPRLGDGSTMPTVTVARVVATDASQPMVLMLRLNTLWVTQQATVAALGEGTRITLGEGPVAPS